jgi:ABC-2 type transport system permease protein
MDFLLATPVPIRAVFISKLLQAILPNFSLILLFALPILYGLGAARGYNLLYYPLVLFMLAALALAAAGLSSLLVMAVVRVFPARRVAEVLGLVVGVSSFLCSQSGQLANMNDVSSQQAAAALDALQQINSPWSPLAWAGRGLVALGEGRWLPGGGLALLALSLAAGAFYLSLVTAERLYYTGWASLQSTSRRKKTPVRTAERPAALLWPERLVPPAVRAVIVKDFLVLRRDLRNLSQIITPLILGVIYAFALLRRGGEPPAGRGEAPAWFMAIAKNLMLYGNIGISLFVSWTLLSRLAGMGFSQEGKSYWLIRIAPVSPRKLAAAKFLVAYLPALALGWGFMLAISLLQGASLGTLVYGLAAVALTIAGTTGIYLAFGITGANMEWEDPRKMVSGGSGCLGALVTLVYLVLALLLFFGPAVGVELLGWPAWIGQAIGLALGAAASLFCAIVPTSLVLKQIPRLGESAISK